MPRSLRFVCLWTVLAILAFALPAAAVPVLGSINPTSGYPGTQVTFTGTGFGVTQGSGSVWLGSKLAGSIVSWSDTSIVAVVASGAASGSGQVQQGGTWSNAIAFTVITPTITSISPTTAEAGDAITIDGTNFGASQGSGSVWLGNKLAGSITSWSDTQIVAVVASGAKSGNAQVQQNGVWGNQHALTILTPTLTDVNPSSWVLAGDSVTLTGTNFGATQGSGSVWLGSKLAGSIVSWSDTEIVATVASGAIDGSAQVQRGGVWSNAIAFDVLTPHVNAYGPGGALVGSTVTIAGYGFNDDQGSGKVWLGNQYATVVSWSYSQITVNVPPTATSGTVQVYQNGVWSNALDIDVITCDPEWTAASMTSPIAGDQVWIDDDLPQLENPENILQWDTSRFWSGTQSFRSNFDDPNVANYIYLFGFYYPPLKLNAGEKMFLYVLIDPCAPTSAIGIEVWTNAGPKLFSWGDGAFLEAEALVVDYDMGALPANGTWARLEIDGDTAGLADAEITDIKLVHFGGTVWMDRMGKTTSPSAVRLTNLTHDFDEDAWTTGTPIELTATADTVGAHFRFVLDDNGTQTELQAYSSDNTVTWTPSASGIYRVLAYARDSASTNDWESALAATFEIPCMPEIAAESIDPTDRIVIDDENPEYTTTDLRWSTTQKTLGEQSFRRMDAQSGPAKIENVSIPWIEGESLVFSVLVDECNPPYSLDLVIDYAPTWEHSDGGSSYFWMAPEGSGDNYLGPIPEPGVWTRVAIPFSAMDDVGYTPPAVQGLSFGFDASPVWIDAVGTTCAPLAGSAPIEVPNDETTWFDDAPAAGMTASGDATSDTSYTHFEDTDYSYKMGGRGSFAQSFTGASTPLAVSVGDALFVYAQFHPCNMPKEVVISWHTTNNEWKRAYWGHDTLYSKGYESEIGFYRVGELPTSEWQMLSVPAALVDLEGESIDGVSIETVDGLMWFQHFGIAPPRCITPAGTISTPSDEVLWFDDAAPSGASTSGTWTWGAPAASGTQSHTDGFAFGAHQHAFTGATDGPTLNAGDLLSVWAQYSHCAPPRQIIIGSGSHFAYWGENVSDFGHTGATFTHMGPLPAAGAWHRLEIPATVLDLVNAQVEDLVFGAYDGQVWFDRASRMPEPAAITELLAPRTVFTPGDVAAISWSGTGAGTLEYRLEVRNIYTQDLVVLQDWSTSTSYNWTTSTFGGYTLELYVRNAYGQTRTQKRIQVGVL